MESDEYLPIIPSYMEQAVEGLSLAEIGVFYHLIMKFWGGGPITSKMLEDVLGFCDKALLKSVLDKKFKQDDSGWVHEGLDAMKKLMDSANLLMDYGIKLYLPTGSEVCEPGDVANFIFREPSDN
jgi:hypothetical protein